MQNHANENISKKIVLFVTTITTILTPYMASSINIALPSIGKEFDLDAVTLSWVDYTGFESTNYTSHSSSYILSGTNLQRTYDGVTSIVGRHITSVGFTQNGRVISVIITATGSGAQPRSETLKFSAYIRSEALVQ